jgi:adenylate cyclase
MNEQLPLLLAALAGAAPVALYIARAKPAATHTVHCPMQHSRLRRGPRTFVVADLVGYTALTEAQGDEHAAVVVGRFRRAVRSLVSRCAMAGLRWTGDGVLLAFDDSRAAVDAALRLAGGVDGLPPVRVGVHTGTAVRRRGDWFGAGVNLAARVADVAGGGEVVVTQATREACAELDGVELRALQARRFKNVNGDVVLYAIAPAPCPSLPTAPGTLSPAL